jgi:hypothetical protein
MHENVCIALIRGKISIFELFKEYALRSGTFSGQNQKIPPDYCSTCRKTTGYKISVWITF